MAGTNGKEMASGRLNLRLAEAESQLANDLAEEYQVSIKEVLMQGLNCLAKQTGRKPLEMRELRNKFFGKGEASEMMLAILAEQEAPISTLDIIDRLIQRKNIVLDAPQMISFKRSVSANLSQMAKAGRIHEAFKEKSVHWKIGKPTEVLPELVKKVKSE